MYVDWSALSNGSVSLGSSLFGLEESCDLTKTTKKCKYHKEEKIKLATQRWMTLRRKVKREDYDFEIRRRSTSQLKVSSCMKKKLTWREEKEEYSGKKRGEEEGEAEEQEQ